MADDIIAQMQADAGQSSQAPQSIIDQMRADAGIEQAAAHAKYDAGVPGSPLQIHVTGTGLPTDKPIDPSEGGSTLQLGPLDMHIPISQGVTRFLAGAGKAFEDTGRGIGNIVTDAIPAAANLGFSTRADTDENKKLDAPLMNTGSGIAGNILGNVAAYAPLSMIPGAATIGGGAALGAASGALQPVGTGDSRGVNSVVGGALGAAIPSAVRLAKTLRAGLVDPFTDAGRTKIAGSLINRASADPRAVADNLANSSAYTPGFQPTVGQAAGDDGVAALQRTMEAVDPAGFNGVRQGQTSALADALRGIAGTPEARSQAVNAREAAVAPLYTTAKSAVVEGDPALTSLMQRPSMQAATGEAGKLAKEQGRTFAMSSGAPAQTVPTGVLDAQGNPLTNTIAATPATYGGQALHDLKMGLDSAIGSPIPGAGGMQGAQRDAAIGTKEQYLNWLESKIPAYADAKNKYAEMSKPISQMDIGSELYNRFIPALADTGSAPFKSRADALATALRNGDQVARNVTGLKGTSLESIMTPEQMSTLNGVVKDSAMRAAMDNAGRGAGSDTVQKISMSNIAAQAGIPNWLSTVAKVPGGWAKRAGDILYQSSDADIRNKLSGLLRDPQSAAAAMRAAGASSSQIAQALRASAQGVTLAAPATIDALQ